MTFGAPVPALRLETWKVVGLEVLGPVIPLASGEFAAPAPACAPVLGELRIGDMPLHAVPVSRPLRSLDVPP